MTYQSIEIEPPEGTRYESLLRCALRYCRLLRLVLHPHRNEFFRGGTLVAALDAHLVGVVPARAWPGTELAGDDEAELRTYAFTDAVADIILTSTSGLSSWGYPILPDDPQLLRADGSVWFASTVHEGWAWLELDGAERAEVSSVSPDLIGEAIDPD